MKRLLPFLILLFCAKAHASFPYIPVVQVGIPGSRSADCVFAADVTSGHFVIVSAVWLTTGGTPAVPTDTVGSTYNQDLLNVVPTNRIAVYSTTLVSSGMNTVSLSSVSVTWENIHCVEIDPQGLTLTVDASASADFVASPVTSTLTTTLSGDLLYSFIGGLSNGQTFYPHQPFIGPLSNTGTFDGASQSISIAGLAGSKSVIWDTGNGGTTGTVAFVAYKSTAGITITSPTTLPDGALSNAYNYTLLANGGTGAYTWSITSGSLQPGLSLNASTGQITGTPTSGPQNSITFHVTDGMNTADLMATLRVAVSMNTITFVQGFTANAGGGGFVQMFVSPVTTGNLLVLGQGTNSLRAGQKCTDTFGTVFKMVAIAGGQNLSTSSTYADTILTGIAAGTGMDTITCLGVANSFPVFLSEFSNAYSFGSENVVLTATQGSSPFTSSAITTLVPGQVLYVDVSSNGAGPAFTVTAPLVEVYMSALHNPEDGYQIVTTVSSYTPSFTFTGSCAATTNACGMITTAFRPTGGATAPAISIIHSTQEY